ARPRPRPRSWRASCSPRCNRRIAPERGPTTAPPPRRDRVAGRRCLRWKPRAVTSDRLEDVGDARYGGCIAIHDEGSRVMTYPQGQQGGFQADPYGQQYQQQGGGGGLAQAAGLAPLIIGGLGIVGFFLGFGK